MALDFLKSLFGGSEQESTSVSTPIDLTPPEFAGTRGTTATALTGGTQTGGPTYGGPLFSPLTGAEGTTLAGLPALGGAGSPAGGYLRDVLSGNYLPGQGGSNPFLDAIIQSASRPILEGLTETLGRVLPGRFTAAGQFTQPQGSSAFDRAAALATRGAANAIGDIGTKLGFGVYEGERQRQQQAAQLQQQEVDQTIKVLQAQALPRMIQELGIERGIALFQQRANDLLKYLQLALEAGKPTVGQQQTTVSKGESTGGILPAFKPTVAVGGK